LFTLSEDGHLQPQDPAEVTTVEGAGPRHIAFHPNKRFAYCVNELNSSVDVWQLSDAHGKIECVQTLDMMPADFSDTAGRAISILRRMAVTCMPATVPPA
jgi:6-phosphogluconolactonase